MINTTADQMTTTGIISHRTKRRAAFSSPTLTLDSTEGHGTAAPSRPSRGAFFGIEMLSPIGTAQTLTALMSPHRQAGSSTSWTDASSDTGSAQH